MRYRRNLTRLAILGAAFLSWSPESRAQECSWNGDGAKEADSSEVVISLEPNRLSYHNRSPYYASCLLSGESAGGSPIQRESRLKPGASHTIENVFGTTSAPLCWVWLVRPCEPESFQ